MMVEKRIGSLIRMDVESETKSCSSLLWDELDLLNYSRLFERLERGNIVKYSRESTWKQMNRWESNISNQYDPRKY